MMLADAHMHVFPNGYRRAGHGSLFGAREFDAYCTLRKSHGIECALAIGYEADDLDPQNNAHLRRLAAEHDWLYSLAYLAPQSKPHPQTIARLMDDGHSGLAIYVPDAGSANALLRWARPVWEVLRASEAVVSFNAPPESIAVLAPLVRDVPEVSFLFSHLGLPGPIAPDSTEEGLRERLATLLSLARVPNAFVKISGLYATSDPTHGYPHSGGGRVVRMLLDTFGAEQCLWASDFSPALDFVSFPQVVDVCGFETLSPADRKLVVRDNLVRLLGAISFSGRTTRHRGVQNNSR